MTEEYNLSEKEIMCNCYECTDGLAFHKSNVKEKTQRVIERLKKGIDSKDYLVVGNLKKFIDKVFLEEFGEKLI